MTLGDEKKQAYGTQVGYIVQSKGLCLLPWSEKTEALNKEEGQWGWKAEILIILDPWTIHSGQI